MASSSYTDAPHLNERHVFKPAAPSGDASSSGASSPSAAKEALRERQLAAAYRHDVFNLAALGVINAMNFWYLWSGEGALLCGAVSAYLRDGAAPDVQGGRAGFRVFWATTMLYFLADFLWILRDPLCVRSPRNILLHHCLSAVFALWPFWYPYLAPKMSYVMTVEVRYLLGRVHSQTGCC